MIGRLQSAVIARGPMDATGWQRIRGALILGAVLSAIGMAGRYTKEPLPNYRDPV